MFVLARPCRHPPRGDSVAFAGGILAGSRRGGHGVCFTWAGRNNIGACHHGRDGSLYGLTQDFYTYRRHFFRFTPPATLKFLGSYHFPGSGSFGPQIQAPDGNFYGTLMGDVHHPGWVYQLTPAGAFHIVATFNGRNGAGPDELALGADGSLYGTTEGGGGTGGGVIFRLTLPRRTR